MRLICCLISLLTMLVSQAAAPSPTDGRAEGRTYVNEYFHISYSLPKFLNAIDTKSLALSQLPPNGYEFLLFAARQGDEPFGVLVLGEKLHVPTAHTSGFRDGADFLDRAVRSFDPAGHPKILMRRHFINSDGIPIDELDYLIYGEQTSGIAAQLGDFLIVFKCNAKSAADLAQMTKSAADLHRTN